MTTLGSNGKLASIPMSISSPCSKSLIIMAANACASYRSPTLRTPQRLLRLR